MEFHFIGNVLYGMLCGQRWTLKAKRCEKPGWLCVKKNYEVPGTPVNFWTADLK